MFVLLGGGVCHFDDIGELYSELSVQEVTEDEFIRYLTNCTKVDQIFCLLQFKMKDGRKMSYSEIIAAFSALSTCLGGMPEDCRNINIMKCRLSYSYLLNSIQYNQIMSGKDAAIILHSMATGWIIVEGKTSIRDFWSRFLKVCGVLIEHVGNLDSKSVADALWAMEKTNFEDYFFYGELINAAEKIPVDDWQPNSISSVLWCLANAQSRFPHSKQISRTKIFTIAEKLIASLVPKINKVRALNHGKIMWSIREMRIYNEDFMRSFEEYIIRSYPSSNFRNCTISSICLAFADFGISLDYRNMIAKRLTKQFCARYDGKAQHIANMIYALAIMGCKHKYPRKILDLLLQQNKQQIPNNFFNEVELAMIRRAQLHMRVLLKKELELPADLEKQCTLANQKQAKQNGFENHSGILEEVYTIVLQVFPNATKQTTFLNDEFFAHVRFFDGSQFVSVDITSPSNYVSNMPDYLMNTLLQKHFLLESEGYRVVVVNNYKWKNDENYKQEIVKELQLWRGKSRPPARIQQQQQGPNGNDKQLSDESVNKKFSLSTELERWNENSENSEQSDLYQQMSNLGKEFEDFI